MHAKFGATRFHGFGVMEDTHTLTFIRTDKDRYVNMNVTRWLQHYSELFTNRLIQWSPLPLVTTNNDILETFNLVKVGH